MLVTDIHLLSYTLCCIYILHIRLFSPVCANESPWNMIKRARKLGKPLINRWCWLLVTGIHFFRFLLSLHVRLFLHFMQMNSWKIIKGSCNLANPSFIGVGRWLQTFTLQIHRYVVHYTILIRLFLPVYANEPPWNIIKRKRMLGNPPWNSWCGLLVASNSVHHGLDVYPSR